MKQTNIPNIGRRPGLAASLVIAALTLPVVGYSDTINQTVSNPSSSTQPSWNSAIWGTPAAAPTSGNSYVTVAGGFSAANTQLGVSVTGRVREDGEAFAGDSITVSPNTEILFKGIGNTSTGNVILNGGVLRYSPNNPGGVGTLAGTLDITAESYLGIAQQNTSSFDVNSTLTGSSLLHLAAGISTGSPGALNIVFGGDLSGYNGTFDLGGGTGSFTTATLGFGQAYALSAGLMMGQYATADILNLDYNLSVTSFTFGANSLADGTYSVSQLNSLYGSGSQFTGTGSLTVGVVPEPGTMALASLAGGVALLLGRRQKRK